MSRSRKKIHAVTTKGMDESWEDTLRGWEKKVANRKVRHTSDIPSGASYKKIHFSKDSIRYGFREICTDSKETWVNERTEEWIEDYPDMTDEQKIYLRKEMERAYYRFYVSK